MKNEKKMNDVNNLLGIHIEMLYCDDVYFDVDALDPIEDADEYYRKTNNSFSSIEELENYYDIKVSDIEIAYGKKHNIIYER